jgi:hypothetical protein
VGEALAEKRRVDLDDLGRSADPPAKLISTAGPLAVRGDDAGPICGVSPRLWRSLDSAAKVPRGIRLGGSRAKIWIVAELSAWLAAGAPPRDRWEAMKEQQQRK